MTPCAIERRLWAVAALAMVTGAIEAAGSRGAIPSAASRMSAGAVIPATRGDSLAEWTDIIVDRDPFRLERAPADVRYGIVVTSVDTTRVVAHAPRPVFALLGIAGGPPWQAVVRGFPGHNGSLVVSPNQHVDSFYVVGVSRDTVVLSGPDTTWKLVARRGSL